MGESRQLYAWEKNPSGAKAENHPRRALRGDREWACTVRDGGAA